MDLFNQKEAQMSSDDVKNWFKNNKPQFIIDRDRQKELAEQRKQDENNNNE